MSTKQQKVERAALEPPLISPQDVLELALPESEVPVLSSTRASALDDYHWEFADFEESYVRSYIALADTKAAWSFTVASGLLAYLFGRNSTQMILLQPGLSAPLISLLLGAILLLVSAFHSFRVVAPRLRSSSADGIIFFGSVARQSSAEKYVSCVAAKDRTALTEARLRHCYDVASVCNSKYDALRKAIWLGLAGLIFAIIYLFLT